MYHMPSSFEGNQSHWPILAVGDVESHLSTLNKCAQFNALFQAKFNYLQALCNHPLSFYPNNNNVHQINHLISTCLILTNIHIIIQY